MIFCNLYTMYDETVRDFLRAFNAKNSLRCLNVLSSVRTEDFPQFSRLLLVELRSGLYSPEESFPAVRNMGIRSAASLMKACLSSDTLLEPEILSAVATRCATETSPDDFYSEERESSTIEALRRGAQQLTKHSSTPDEGTSSTDLGSFFRSSRPTQKVVSNA